LFNDKSLKKACIDPKTWQTGYLSDWGR